MTLPEPAAVCAQVHRHYGSESGHVPALRGVDLTVRAGSVLALMGPSGSGKSTLLRLLGCLDRADRGEVRVAGGDTTGMSRRQRLRLRRHEIGFVFQDPTHNLIEHLTVRQHLELAGALRRLRHAGPAMDAQLERLGLADRAGHLPRQLSGGQQQRLAVAFAALGDPALLVADEPTGQIDHAAAAAVMQALRGLARDGVAVVVATHDPALAATTDQVIHLRDGEIVEAQG